MNELDIIYTVIIGSLVIGIVIWAVKERGS
jgi:hypothetical protein